MEVIYAILMWCSLLTRKVVHYMQEYKTDNYKEPGQTE